MSFESLSERHEFQIADFPEEWLPLTHLYDPDLPLFPLLYFHVLDPTLANGERPGERDRVFGFVHHINMVGATLWVTVALNKDLSRPQHCHLAECVESEVRHRLGLGDRISFPDLAGQLSGQLAAANNIVKELWYQVIDRQFGKSLPFGRMWDGVFGLARFIASWNSEGRKGELIQTHYFASAFGQRIHTGNGIHVDYFLLPTFEELTDLSNPLSLYPKFASLVFAATSFVNSFCESLMVGSSRFSAFRMAKTGLAGSLDTAKIREICGRSHGNLREALFENYNAFNRGPQRSVIALMMLNDLRNGYWDPRALTPDFCADMYTSAVKSYQSPKVIQLYAQQCFASTCALPIDNWVLTFVKWPLGFTPTSRKRYHVELFSSSNVWGKLERLIWMASQARKVHSLACAEILWCVRYGGPEKKMRGANPFACKVCETHVRNQCPAFAAIKSAPILFDAALAPVDGFLVKTSAPTSGALGHALTTCLGRDTFDEYTVNDRPSAFAKYPAPGHGSGQIDVDDFIRLY